MAPLGIADAAKATRVRDLIVDQYRGLREIHDARDAKIAEAPKSPGDAAVANAWRSRRTQRGRSQAVPAASPIRGAARGRADAGASESSQGRHDVRRGADDVSSATANCCRTSPTNSRPRFWPICSRPASTRWTPARRRRSTPGSASTKAGSTTTFRPPAIDMKQAEKDLAEREKAAATLNSDFSLSQRRRDAEDSKHR